MFNSLFSVGAAMNLIFCLQCLWEYHPNHRGFVTGIIMVFYKTGSLLVVFMFNKLVNPKNIPKEEIAKETLHKIYPKEVT